MTNTFGCPNATEITRRDGPDIACTALNAHRDCEEFYRELKSQALIALGYKDDPTQTPASIVQKIQYGGLLGLQGQVMDNSVDSVKNIEKLVSLAHQKYGNLSNFPYQYCIDSIRTYKLKRRRDR